MLEKWKELTAEYWKTKRLEGNLLNTLFPKFNIYTVLAMKNTVELEDGFPAKLLGLQ